MRYVYDITILFACQPEILLFLCIFAFLPALPVFADKTPALTAPAVLHSITLHTASFNHTTPPTVSTPEALTCFRYGRIRHRHTNEYSRNGEDSNRNKNNPLSREIRDGGIQSDAALYKRCQLYGHLPVSLRCQQLRGDDSYRNVKHPDTDFGCYRVKEYAAELR